MSSGYSINDNKGAKIFTVVTRDRWTDDSVYPLEDQLWS